MTIQATPRRNVDRLLPNHVLRLDGWRPWSAGGRWGHSRTVEHWIARLPPLSPFEITDLAQVEQSQAAWDAVIEYGELGQSSARLSPLTSAALVRTALRLPAEYRMARRLHHDVIGLEWPELLEVPFNEDFPTPPVRRRIFALRASLAERRRALARAWRKAWTKPASLRVAERAT